MSDDSFEIAPARVPLSHKPASDDGSAQHTGNPAIADGPKKAWLAPAALTLLAVVAAALLWLVDGRSAPISTPGQAGAKSAAPTASPDKSVQALPPFASSQQAVARERAQAALSKFVELQLQLEEQMAVGDWGQDAFDSALAQAAAGDEDFVAERFAQAQAAYDGATTSLESVIERGGELVQEALRIGAEAIDAQDTRAALAAFDQALAIDADNQMAQQGRERAARLPQIKKLQLRARNHELAGDWSAALADYEAILALDQDTVGIDQLLDSARQAVGQAQLKQTLSKGFAALEQRRFDEAREAFNQALQRSPGNEIALGGLQQVGDRTELKRIATLQQDAEQAVANENWQAAVAAYEAALQLDPNIQFAKVGLRGAKEQRKAAALLGKIVAEPDKLSSAQLLEQGQAQLAAARELSPIGPKLQTLIARSAELLAAYAEPVAVQLTSDNQTEVLVSTVGKLGAFERRELSLRPGEYVLLGSRSGCRDVRRTVVVSPGMQPIDIRCEQVLRP